VQLIVDLAVGFVVSVRSRPKGTVSVAYASSLEYLNEKVVGPAFEKAEGYKYSGPAQPPDTVVGDRRERRSPRTFFESVGADNITPLEPAFTKW